MEFSGLVKKITGNGFVNRAIHRGTAGNGREKEVIGLRERKHIDAKLKRPEINLTSLENNLKLELCIPLCHQDRLRRVTSSWAQESTTWVQIKFKKKQREESFSFLLAIRSLHPAQDRGGKIVSILCPLSLWGKC